MPAKKTTQNNQTVNVDAALAMGQETVEKVMQAGQDALDMIDTTKTVDVARQQVATASKTLFGGNEQLAAFNMAVFDSYATAFGSMTKGAEVFGKEFADYTRKSFETSVANNQSLMACKSANEALDLQSGFTRTSFDSAVSQGAKLTEMTLKTANESLAPLQDQAKQAFSTAFSTPST